MNNTILLFDSQPSEATIAVWKLLNRTALVDNSKVLFLANGLHAAHLHICPEPYLQDTEIETLLRATEGLQIIGGLIYCFDRKMYNEIWLKAINMGEGQ